MLVSLFPVFGVVPLIGVISTSGWQAYVMCMHLSQIAQENIEFQNENTLDRLIQGLHPHRFSPSEDGLRIFRLFAAFPTSQSDFLHHSEVHVRICLRYCLK